MMKFSILKQWFAFCLLLVLARVFHTGNLSFVFLFWNLFLAYLPYFFVKSLAITKSSRVKFLLVGLSVLFLPNAPYILTDLFHLHKNLIAPMWFDLILISSFALLGLLYFVMSYKLIIRYLKEHIHTKALFYTSKALILLSSGYGIYLGRYLRFNSWDVVSNPITLFNKMADSIFNIHHAKETFAITVVFALFLYLVTSIFEQKPKFEI